LIVIQLGLPTNSLNGETLHLKQKFVIVGHGLAGAVLSQALDEMEQELVVLEAGMADSASRVSAGLINPFIGPKLNIPEDFSLCMDENQNFFKKREEKYGQKFLEPIELYRIFSLCKQKERWCETNDLYRKKTLTGYECSQIGVHALFGAGKSNAWKLRSLDFIKHSKTLFQSKGRYLIEEFDPYKWKNWQVIFCDGFRGVQNQWFKYLPFAPAQGDVITIKTNLNLNLSNGTWHLTENKGDLARIGSTWKHTDIESGPTLEARKEIFRKIDYLPKIKEKQIVSHLSGVRSSTLDRQPFLGTHPEIKNYHIFNGFGSRGCTTIALSARQLAFHLTQGIPLPDKKDIRRFSS
jgi:glycine/D-amino acid oxidase-like deaminating enzyme